MVELQFLFSGCPESISKTFKVIQGKCYAFENQKRTFDATQTRCGQIFPNNINGKVFEPRSDQVLEDVLKYAKIAWDGASPQTWLGITDKAMESNFVYPSNGDPHKLSWDVSSTFNQNSVSYNCLLLHPTYADSRNSYHHKMHHWSCSKTLAAICEMIP